MSSSSVSVPSSSSSSSSSSSAALAAVVAAAAKKVRKFDVIDSGDWKRALQQSKVKKQSLNALVGNYLLHEGYDDVAKAFQRETKTKMVDAAPSISIRPAIRKSILSGNIPHALSLLHSSHPSFSSSHPLLEFRLQCQRFLEFLRSGRLVDALEFAQKELATRAANDDELLREMETMMALIAFSPGDFSPYSHYFSASHRHLLASQVNEALLASDSLHNECKLMRVLKKVKWGQQKLEEKLHVKAPAIAFEWPFPTVAQLTESDTKQSGEQEAGSNVITATAAASPDQSPMLRGGTMTQRLMQQQHHQTTTAAPSPAHVTLAPTTSSALSSLPSASPTPSNPPALPSPFYSMSPPSASPHSAPSLPPSMPSSPFGLPLGLISMLQLGLSSQPLPLQQLHLATHPHGHAHPHPLSYHPHPHQHLHSQTPPSYAHPQLHFPPYSYPATSAGAPAPPPPPPPSSAAPSVPFSVFGRNRRTPPTASQYIPPSAPPAVPSSSSSSSQQQSRSLRDDEEEEEDDEEMV